MGWTVSDSSWNQAIWHSTSVLNQFRSALQERCDILGVGLPSSLSSAVAQGDIVQSTSFWNPILSWISGNCSSFLQSHSVSTGGKLPTGVGTSDSYHGKFSIPNWTFSNLMKSVYNSWSPSGDPPGGWIFAQSLPSNWEDATAPQYIVRGSLQEHDILGPWLFRMIQDAINRLIHTQHGTTSSDTNNSQTAIPSNAGSGVSWTYERNRSVNYWNNTATPTTENSWPPVFECKGRSYWDWRNNNRAEWTCTFWSLFRNFTSLATIPTGYAKDADMFFSTLNPYLRNAVGPINSDELLENLVDASPNYSSLLGQDYSYIAQDEYDSDDSPYTLVPGWTCVGSESLGSATTSMSSSYIFGLSDSFATLPPECDSLPTAVYDSSEPQNDQDTVKGRGFGAEERPFGSWNTYRAIRLRWDVSGGFDYI